MSIDERSDVIVVGAGPTGLALAIAIRLMGSEVLVIDARAGPRAWAPALAVQPRTLEVLELLGVVDGVLAHGRHRVNLEIHVGNRVVTGAFDRLALPGTKYPFIHFIAQPGLERALRHRLQELGCSVQWNQRLVGIEHSETGVIAVLEAGNGGVRRTSGEYLVACDGPDSTVRRLLHLGFPGKTYSRSLIVGDARVDGLAVDTAQAWVSEQGIAFTFPLTPGRWRVIVPVTDRSSSNLAEAVENHTGGRVRLSEISDVALVTPERRMADRFRLGHVLLAGDAAHVRSPAGAQGMNTGIQDAVNLGWKLALAARGAPERLIASYETERRSVARRTALLTEVAFAVESSQLWVFRIGRRLATLPLARLALANRWLLGLVAKPLSGLGIRYRKGALETVAGLALGRVGRRVPGNEVADSFRVYFGDGRERRMAEDLARAYPGLIRVDDGSRRSELVRPDGHVAVEGNVDRIRRFLSHWLDGEGSAAT